jgi:hypothetical protein
MKQVPCLGSRILAWVYTLLYVLKKTVFVQKILIPKKNLVNHMPGICAPLVQWNNVMSQHSCSNLIYKDEMVFCSFLFVCMELIQIHISEPISTILCTHLPLHLEEVVGYVWTHNISPFSTSSVRIQCRILGTTWLPAQESFRQRFTRDLADDTCIESYPWYSRRQMRIRTANALHCG